MKNLYPIIPPREQRLPIDWQDCAWSPKIKLARTIKPLLRSPLFAHLNRRHQNIMNMKTHFSEWRRSRAAFTLVELLTVIAIIAILAAMLLPVISHVRTTALKAKARIEAQALVTAIEGYDSAYGRFPVSSDAQKTATQNANDPTKQSGDFTYGGTFQKQDGSMFLFGTQVNGSALTNSEVIAILMDITNYPTGGSTINTNHTKNPQQTKFLNATPAPDITSPGVGSDLVYRDPWGNPYIITMDLNYDENCEDAFYNIPNVATNSASGLTLQPDGNYAFHGKVMVWSAGPPALNGKAALDYSQITFGGINKNHILSWQ